MQSIRLQNAAWYFDEAERLGRPGGFGEVFRGNGDLGAVAIKRLKLTAEEAAFRELKIGGAIANRALQHVVPILDCGLDAESDRYFIVMPICDYSLADCIACDAPFDATSLSKIALDIIAGLQEVDDIVHRDLKPGNVLLLEGRWCLADFGLAKFVEDSTSLQTVREYLTPAYAAPEQWRGESTSHEADVYALGCIIYELASGLPPFSGTLAEVRNGHLLNAAPVFPQSSARLSALFSQMLRKPPHARPSLRRCRDVFTQTISEGAFAPKRQHLFEAVAHIEAESAKAEALRQAAAARRKLRDDLAVEAVDSLRAIRRKIFNEISSLTNECRSNERQISLGFGKLEFGRVDELAGSEDGNPNCPRSGWDVCALTLVRVEQFSGRDAEGRPQYVWTSTLAFAAVPGDPIYRWREVSFFTIAGGDNEPFALSPAEQHFDVAMAPALGTLHVAFGPKTIDAEDEPDFIERWLFLFSKAALGKLTRPHSLPIDDNFFRVNG